MARLIHYGALVGFVLFIFMLANIDRLVGSPPPSPDIEFSKAGPTSTPGLIFEKPPTIE